MWKAFLLVFVTVFALQSAFAAGGLVGGFQDMDVNSEGVRSALDFAVAQHNRASNDLYLSQVAEVVSAQAQVVSGMKYVITVRMGKTSCRKGSANEVCAVNENSETAPHYQCTFTIWSRPWMNFMALQSEKCQK